MMKRGGQGWGKVCRGEEEREKGALTGVPRWPPDEWVDAANVRG